MAKPMLVTVPFLLLLLDYWPLDRFRRAAGAGPQAESRSWLGRLPVGWRLVVEKIPLMALAAVSCGIVLSTHSSMQVEQSSRPIVAGDTPGQCPGFVRSLLGPVLLSRRFGSLLSSSRHPPADRLGCRITGSAGGDHRGRHVLSGAGGLICWSAGCGFWECWCRSSDWWESCIHARADRYTYLSQIGLSIALAWGVWSVYRSRQSLQAARWRRWMLAVVSGAAVLAACRRRMASNFLLAQCRDALDAYDLLHRAKSDGSL